MKRENFKNKSEKFLKSSHKRKFETAVTGKDLEYQKQNIIDRIFTE